ncbi:MAG: histidine kinase [Anaerolineae bacterium]|nr:histidine kinase [Anaerolineae bacterium]
MVLNNDEIFGASPKDEMIDLITQKVTHIKRRLGEIVDQVETVKSSVDREQSRYSNIATELRSIKENLDTVPREDIRDKYEEALDVRFRLATMRGQQEKFESSRDLMEEEIDLLQQIVGHLQGIDMADIADASGSSSNGSLDIVGIIRTQEDEREKLARAMHDGPAQSLTNFILQAEIVQKLFTKYPDRAGEELDSLKGNASKTFRKVRDFIFDLRPMMLNDLGAAPTIRRYVESYKEKSDIDVQLEIFGDERRLEEYREVMIFRGIQEVMGLARDYAAPTEIDVQLDMAASEIRISIEDNGRGFDAEGMFEDGEEDNYTDARVQALRMLKSKFELVSGTLDVRSDENEGTIIRMELPTGE